MTPDPARNSAGPTDPGSWNRYSYTRGDPINRYDPSGLDDEGPHVNPYDGAFSLIMQSLSHGYTNDAMLELAEKRYEQFQDRLLAQSLEALRKLGPRCRDLFDQKLNRNLLNSWVYNREVFWDLTQSCVFTHCLKHG
jgi:hypothetical protein